MTLSRRVSLIVAGAVTLAVILTATASYFAVSTELLRQTDRQLRAQAKAVTEAFDTPRAATFFEEGSADRRQQPFEALGSDAGGPLGTMQLAPADGGAARTVIDMGGARAPIDATDRAIATGKRGTVIRTIDTDRGTVRAITVRLGSLGAMKVSQPIRGIVAVDRKLALVLLLIGASGIALGLVASVVLTRRVTAPVRDLADTTRHIAETDDLTRRIPDPDQDDEIGQLARQFNAMLDSLQASRAELAGSVRAQRQLVADASHELRTPITSLRTNLELLLEGAAFSDVEREQVLASLVEETTELGDLVGDVINLARGDAAPPTLEPVDLAELARECVERARRHHPDVAFRVYSSPTTLQGAPERLSRAVANLLDNAAKHSSDCGTVDVTVEPTTVIVRDYGPGISDEDLPYVFDRFYRGANDRGVSGTGLGLAIVRQVAEIHGGTVTAANVHGGGAAFHLTLDPEGTSGGRAAD